MPVSPCASPGGWSDDADRGPLAVALDRALVLLADHELATSTLAVRVAASTRTAPYPAYAAGLAVLQGALHGGTSARSSTPARRVRGARGRAGDRPPARGRGSGSPASATRIYRGEDPRLRPLLEAVAMLPDPAGRRDVVDDLLIEAGIRLTRQANVDLALGALTYVGGLPARLPLFAVARLAGFAAHHDEELAERPLRYRGLARRPPSGRPAYQGGLGLRG